MISVVMIFLYAITCTQYPVSSCCPANNFPEPFQPAITYPVRFSLSQSSNPTSPNNRSVLTELHSLDERYGTTEMRAVGSEKYRFACVVAADGALAKAEAAHGMIPPEAAAGIDEHAPEASRERAKSIEPGISHDMMAIVKAISEVCQEGDAWYQPVVGNLICD